MQSHGFKLSSVVSNIVGSSGRKILNKLAEQGALSFEDIMTCYNHRLRKTPEEIYEAVSGKLEEIDCLFLQTELEWLDCIDKQIDKLTGLTQKITKEFEAKIIILDAIPGIDENSATEILAEISDTPCDSFSTASHLSNWAGLAPRNDESAGNIKSKKSFMGTLMSKVYWFNVHGLPLKQETPNLLTGSGLIRQESVERKPLLRLPENCL